MKWFWISLFGFLVVLIVLLGAARPDQLDNALAYVGLFFFWFVTGLGLLATLAVVIAGYLVFNRQRMRNLRQKDGAWPLQRVRVGGFLGFGGRIRIVDLNAYPGYSLEVDTRTGEVREGEPATGWGPQLHFAAMVEKSKAMRAIFPGDDARTNKYGSLAKSPNFTAAAARALQPEKQPMLPDRSPGPPSGVVVHHTAQSAITAARPDYLPLGTDTTGNTMEWPMSQSVHLRIHGTTQVSGKTNLLKTIAAGALRQNAHVLVLDRRRFKDWQAFKGYVEMVDTRDTDNLTMALQRIAAIYQARDQAIANGTFSMDQRIIVVVSEFGTLYSIAKADGVFGKVESVFDAIMREAGGTGVHMVLEDQSPQGWPHGAIVNAVPVTGQVPMNYGSTVGYHDAHKLPPYQFHMDGKTFDTWDTKPELPALLANVPRLNGYQVIEDESSAVHGAVHETVHSPVHEAVHPEVAPPPSMPMNGTNGAGPYSPKWRAFTDAWFAANPHFIAEPYGGISELARAMAQEEGRSDWENYKSVAKEYFDAFLSEFKAWAGTTTKE